MEPTGLNFAQEVLSHHQGNTAELLKRGWNLKTKHQKKTHKKTHQNKNRKKENQPKKNPNKNNKKPPTKTIPALLQIKGLLSSSWVEHYYRQAMQREFLNECFLNVLISMA